MWKEQNRQERLANQKRVADELKYYAKAQLNGQNIQVAPFMSAARDNDSYEGESGFPKANFAQSPNFLPTPVMVSHDRARIGVSTSPSVSRIKDP